MQSWLGGKVIRWMLGRLNRGDVRSVVRLDAPDVELVFPGENSWAGVIRGREEHRKWLERFARVGLQIFADEVIVKGLPWRSTVCIRGHDTCDGPDGERVYDNRYVIWGRLVWGRLKQYEVYEDTEKTQAFDRWLEANEHRLGQKRRRLRAAA
jgi:ketosteroid isomerase-like protein